MQHSATKSPEQGTMASIDTADVVWVGGGSVANLLALWRLHGVDRALVRAWASRTALVGVRAGGCDLGAGRR